MDYTIYAKHPDDGEVKVIVTPWKPDLLVACEKAERRLAQALGEDDLLPILNAAIAKAKGE